MMGLSPLFEKGKHLPSPILLLLIPSLNRVNGKFTLNRCSHSKHWIKFSANVNITYKYSQRLITSTIVC